MDAQDKRIQKIEEKYVQQIMDKEEEHKVRAELHRLNKEIETLETQRRELKSQLKGYKNSQFRMNLDIGFVPKSNMMRR